MELSELLLEIESLKKRLLFLEQENTQLRNELSNYKIVKNSNNSSTPPSKDVYRFKGNQSLRTSSGKPLGGQPGHKGNTLRMVDTADVIIDLIPDYCHHCGCSLEKTKLKEVVSRQQIDLPPITPIYTEYRSHSKQCACGKLTNGSFPTWVQAPISYGPNIEALVAYLHSRQYLPYARTKELFNDLFNVSISQGGIESLLKRFAKKTIPVYEQIKQRLSHSECIGSDETSVNINGKNHWIWAWQTPKLTYISHSSNRAAITIEKQFLDGFPQSILVSDGWKPQLNTNALGHQSCIAHLLRRLNYLKEKYNHDSWASDFQQVLYDALELKKEHTFNSGNYRQKRMKIIRKFENLLEHPPDKKHKECYTFYKRMGRERQYLFVFLYIKDVPPDNNASERAIRNIKVKQKISGQFKREYTAQNFAMIRSVFDTTIKNGREVLAAMTLIAKAEFNLLD